MSQAAHILRKAIESLKGEALRARDAHITLQKEADAKASEVASHMKKIQELEDAITKLENPENVTSKNKKIKR